MPRVLEKTEVVGRFTGSDVECPMCKERLVVEVHTEVIDVSARTSGGTSFVQHISLDVQTGDFWGVINHTCKKRDTNKHRE